MVNTLFFESRKRGSRLMTLCAMPLTLDGGCFQVGYIAGPTGGTILYDMIFTDNAKGGLFLSIRQENGQSIERGVSGNENLMYNVFFHIRRRYGIAQATA